MIVMKFGGTSVQDAQAIDRVAAIVREHLQLEIFPSPKLRPTTKQVSGHDFSRAVQPQNILGFSPCKKDRLNFTVLRLRSLNRPAFFRTSAPSWWVGYKMRSSPVGAAQESHTAFKIANTFPSPRRRATTTQVSGHEFTRAVQPQNISGFSPCEKDSQGLKANPSRPFTARLKSCPDTCLAIEEKTVVLNSTSPMAVLRASVPPWWRLSR